MLLTFWPEFQKMLEKALGFPVPGTILLSLSGHPLTLTLSCSLEIAKAPGPVDGGKALELRISAEPDILARNLADKFCQSVPTDTLI